MNDEFLILSLKWTTGDVMVWYRPECKGYTSQIELAGRFSAEEISSSPAYYDNRDSTMAVPLSAAIENSTAVVLNLDNILDKLRSASTMIK